MARISKKKNQKLSPIERKYEGELREPIGTHLYLGLSPKELEEHKEEKIKLLFEFFNIELTSSMENNYKKLLLALAEKHVPGFQIEYEFKSNAPYNKINVQFYKTFFYYYVKKKINEGAKSVDVVIRNIVLEKYKTEVHFDLYKRRYYEIRKFLVDPNIDLEEKLKDNYLASHINMPEYKHLLTPIEDPSILAEVDIPFGLFEIHSFTRKK